MKTSSIALAETKGWLLIGALVAGAAVVGYFVIKKFGSKILSDATALPGQLVRDVGSALSGAVSGTADAVGQFGLATNDALGGLPGDFGNAIVTTSQSIGGAWFGEKYTGYTWGAKENRWIQVVGMSTGNTYNVDANGNVLDSSGATIGQFRG